MYDVARGLPPLDPAVPSESLHMLSSACFWKHEGRTFPAWILSGSNEIRDWTLNHFNFSRIRSATFGAVFLDYVQAKSDCLTDVCEGFVTSGAFGNATRNVQAPGNVTIVLLPDPDLKALLVEDVCQ